MAFRIEQCFMFVSEDEDGEEGLIAQFVLGGELEGPHWLPFVCTDRNRVDSLRPMAREVARETGRKVTLLRFGGQREELEVFD